MKKEIKLTILGHACLYVEFEYVKLLIDPWLYGSTYWRSWWNYPEINDDNLAIIEPTHIYLTHLHWDHFHGPSLRKFEKFKPTILLPYSCTKRMIVDIKRDFKFNKVEELRHAKKYFLTDDFEITSYQFGPIIIDSALVINAGGKKILDANDTKFFGNSLNQISKIHGDFDFVLRSHSSATEIPYCIEDSQKYGFTRTPEDYSIDFINFAMKVKAKYAIPFASSHIYLHRNSYKYNEFYNSPQFVKEKFDNLKIKSPECVLMPSGSSWSSIKGFSLVNNDYKNIDQHINNALIKNREKLEKFYAIEEKTRFNLKAFEKYFENFFNSLNFIPLRNRFAFNILPNNSLRNDSKLAIVDLTKKRIKILENCNLDKDFMIKEKLDFSITISAKILNDCCIKRMFNCWGPSKLMQIKLRERKCLSKYSQFISLISLYENDGLPFWKIFTFRQLLNRLSRWREILDIFLYFYLIKLRKKPIHFLWK